MARMTKAQHRAYAEQWQRAGPKLERIHAEELRQRPYNPADADTLLKLGDHYKGPPRLTSGLVEMQRIFMKGARRMGKLPSVVREKQADYGSDIPAAKRQALCTDMGEQTSVRVYHIGNVKLLEQPLTAFFCSVRCPGNLVLKAYDLAQRWRAENQPIIGGFHSPVEKEVLKIMLRSTVPVCVVLARKLPRRIPTEFRRPLDEGRLLLVSPFDAKTRRATQETAAYRNQVVAALADKVFVAYAAPGSKTEAFCREITGTGKTCITFDDPKTANLKAAGFASFSL